MTVTPPLEQSKRVKALRRALLKEIPRFPNDKSTMTMLENKSLVELRHSARGARLLIDLSANHLLRVPLLSSKKKPGQ